MSTWKTASIPTAHHRHLQVRVEMNHILPELLVFVGAHNDHRTAKTVATVEMSQRACLWLTTPPFSHTNASFILFRSRQQLADAVAVQALKHVVNTFSLGQSLLPHQPSSRRPRGRTVDAARRPNTQSAGSFRARESAALVLQERHFLNPTILIRQRHHMVCLVVFTHLTLHQLGSAGQRASVQTISDPYLSKYPVTSNLTPDANQHLKNQFCLPRSRSWGYWRQRWQIHSPYVRNSLRSHLGKLLQWRLCALPVVSSIALVADDWIVGLPRHLMTHATLVVHVRERTHSRLQQKERRRFLVVNLLLRVTSPLRSHFCHIEHVLPYGCEKHLVGEVVL